MLGESFYEDFPTTQINKPQGMLGLSPKSAKIGFISQTPLLGEKDQFLPKKSAQMLENIITKVFHFSLKDCCILSLFKTSQTSYDEHLKQHIEILLSQISQASAKVFVVFGYSEIAQHLLQKEKFELGIPIKFKDRHFVITHSFEALIRLAGLKKQTLEHLNIAKALL